MTKEELQDIKPVVRTKTILNIKVVEKLEPEEEGIELNEGYEYEIEGSLPQLADGFAKMLLELDKDKTMGDRAGAAFLTLIQQYYIQLQS